MSKIEIQSHLVAIESWLAARVADGADAGLLGLAALSAAHTLLEKHSGRKYAAAMARGLSYASDAEMELMREKEREVAEELAAEGFDPPHYVGDLD